MLPPTDGSTFHNRPFRFVKIQIKAAFRCFLVSGNIPENVTKEKIFMLSLYRVEASQSMIDL
jgi:hypothetical protein